MKVDRDARTVVASSRDEVEKAIAARPELRPAYDRGLFSGRDSFGDLLCDRMVEFDRVNLERLQRFTDLCREWASKRPDYGYAVGRRQLSEESANALGETLSFQAYAINWLDSLDASILLNCRGASQDNAFSSYKEVSETAAELSSTYQHTRIPDMLIKSAIGACAAGVQAGRFYFATIVEAQLVENSKTIGDIWRLAHLCSDQLRDQSDHLLAGELPAFENARAKWRDTTVNRLDRLAKQLHVAELRRFKAAMRPHQIDIAAALSAERRAEAEEKAVERRAEEERKAEERRAAEERKAADRRAEDERRAAELRVWNERQAEARRLDLAERERARLAEEAREAAETARKAVERAELEAWIRDEEGRERVAVEAEAKIARELQEAEDRELAALIAIDEERAREAARAESEARRVREAEAARVEKERLAALAVEERRRAEAADRRAAEERKAAERLAWSRNLDRYDPEFVAAMDGSEYERYWVNALQRRGASDVRRVGGAGDHGADVTFTWRGLRYVVQAKRYKGKAPFRAVQEVGFARQHLKYDRAWAVTSSTFTQQAKDAAASNGVELVEGDPTRFLDTFFGAGEESVAA